MCVQNHTPQQYESINYVLMFSKHNELSVWQICVLQVSSESNVLCIFSQCTLQEFRAGKGQWIFRNSTGGAAKANPLLLQTYSTLKWQIPDCVYCHDLRMSNLFKSSVILLLAGDWLIGPMTSQLIERVVVITEKAAVALPTSDLELDQDKFL